jgi:uncharacterized protein (DUF1778 family)
MAKSEIRSRRPSSGRTTLKGERPSSSALKQSKSKLKFIYTKAGAAKMVRKEATKAPRKEAMSRLEARIPKPLYEKMERAAKLRGLSVTAYVTAIMGEHAERTIEQTEIIRLSREGQIAFANALLNPPEPNAKLRAAAKRHAELFGE